jgi:hypothetical protein
MDKKNLAKSALAALLLTAGAGAVQAEAAAFSNEATTYLAVAGCPGGYNNNAPQRRSGGNSQYNYIADDTNNPYANPAMPNQPGAMGGGSYSSDGQQPYGSGYGSNRGMQPSQQGNMSGGGSTYGNPSWSNDPNNPNNPNNPRMGGGSNPNNPANQPSNTWNMNR